MGKLLKVNKKDTNKNIEAYVGAIDELFLTITFFPDFLLKRVKIIELRIEANPINNKELDLLKKLIA